MKHFASWPLRVRTTGKYGLRTAALCALLSLIARSRDRIEHRIDEQILIEIKVRRARHMIRREVLDHNLQRPRARSLDLLPLIQRIDGTHFQSHVAVGHTFPNDGIGELNARTDIARRAVGIFSDELTAVRGWTGDDRTAPLIIEVCSGRPERQSIAGQSRPHVAAILVLLLAVRSVLIDGRNQARNK